MNPSEWMATLDGIEGWFYGNEAELLAKYAGQVTQGDVVEIGSYQGRSTIVLAKSAPENTPVWAIDPHLISEGDNFPFGDHDRAHWARNVLNFGLMHRVRPINLKSQDVAKIWAEPIGLLWIDGAHSYEAVRDDLAGFVPYVVTGGIVALHDCSAPQILQAILERSDLAFLEAADHTRVYRKV